MMPSLIYLLFTVMALLLLLAAVSPKREMPSAVDINSRVETMASSDNEESPNSPNVTPKLEPNDENLLHAAIQGRMDELTKAFQARGNPNVRDPKSGNSALMLACYFGHTEVALALISRGARLSTLSKDKTKTAMLMGVYGGKVELVEMLLEVGANVNQANLRGDTPLAIATYTGNEQIVDLLIRHSADLDHSNKEMQYKPLHIAAIQGHYHISRQLVRAGAEVDALDKDGQTPFMLASRQCSPQVLELLSNSGADPDLRSANGTTALMWAVAKERLPCVMVLLELGVDLDLKNNQGQTALMIGVKTGNTEIVQTLLFAGSNVKAVDSLGRTARKIAEENEELGHMSLLLKDYEEIAGSVDISLDNG